MNKKIFFLLFSAISLAAHSQIAVTKNGIALSRILIDKKDTVDFRAALLLQDFIQRISGAELTILPQTAQKKKGDFLIGNFQLPVAGFNASSIHDDGFFMSTKDGFIRILKAGGKGSIYAVVSLLEQYFNVQYYALNALNVPKNKNLVIPSSVSKIENPSFSYRQTQSYCNADQLYKLWHRLKEPNEVFAGNLWVHTFDKILPSKDFGKSHPEYYSFINGMRRPGAASQWCLTNADLFEIVCHRIDSIFKADPNKNIISVSQNDGNNTNCTCDNCRAIDSAEGGPSGSLIWFMNKLAARFPDKQFFTLAYLYTVSPPKNIKPLPNVSIMLCDIDCKREVPLTENASGKSFVKDMEGWAKITKNIFVWDYGINFDNYISPFPNFHILQPNMQLFKANNATMHFSQIGNRKGTDFTELRTYVVSKLMWNVSLNVDSLVQSFLKGYYGDAAPYVYQYLKLQEGAVMAGSAPLWIYDTPISYKDGMLNASLIKRYTELFDKAEKTVADNKIFLARVQESRLSLQYAELEIARTTLIKDTIVLKQKLDLFRNRAAAADVSILNERLNTVEEYCKLYAERNFQHSKKSLALGASVNYVLPAAKAYWSIADKALTDGLYGGATFNESWVGWEGKDAEFIIDLGEIKEIETIETDFLHKLGSWIFLPKSVSCFLSADNIHYDFIETKNIQEDKSPAVKFVSIPFNLKQKTKSRYIKLKIENIGICPPWHYGVGHPAWMFLDEVAVY